MSMRVSRLLDEDCYPVRIRSDVHGWRLQTLLPEEVGRYPGPTSRDPKACPPANVLGMTDFVWATGLSPASTTEPKVTDADYLVNPMTETF
jgi:hypothetical protein